MQQTDASFKVVIFDMDKTLLSCDSMELWHRFLDGLGIITPQDKQTRARLYSEYVAGTLDIHENFRFEFSLLNRIPVTQKAKVQKYFFENYLKTMVSMKALELIENYRKENAIIILSTSSMRFIADPVANFIKADHVLATEGHVSNNEYTGQVYDPPNYQEGKTANFLNWLRHNNLIPEQVIFYTDSINDIDLLEAVDVPIAVNPDDKLRKRAEIEGWEIVDFLLPTKDAKAEKEEKNTSNYSYGRSQKVCTNITTSAATQSQGAELPWRHRL